MATLGIASGLAGIGYLLNQNKKNTKADTAKEIRNATKRNNGQIHSSRRPDNYNLLESNRSKNVQNTVREIGERHWVDSYDPKRTGVIPSRYNLDNENGSSMSYHTYQTRDPSVENFSSLDGLNNVYGADEGKKFLSGGERKEQTSNYPYPITHNNMVPFFKGNGTGQSMDLSKPSRKLEMFSGVSDYNRVGKKEVGNMFEPQPESISGTPLPDMEEMKNRYVASSFQSNVIPFTQVRTAPGLNQGYTNEGGDARHSMFRPQTRNIDETRVKTNPQITYTTPFTSGRALFNEKPSESAHVSKRRPDRTFETGDSRWFNDGGSYNKQKLEENYQLPISQRGMDGDWEHNVHGDDVGREPMRKDHLSVAKKQLEPDTERNYDGDEGNNGGWVKDEGDIPYETKRDLVKYEYYGTYGNEDNGGWVKDSGDVPRVTKKDITSTQPLQVGGAIDSKLGKGYLTTKWVARNTQRQIQSHNFYTGHGKHMSGDKQGDRLQYENDQSNSLKELTQHRPAPNPQGPKNTVHPKDVVLQNKRITLDVRGSRPIDEELPSVYKTLVRSVVNPTKSKQRYNQRNLMNPGLEDQLMGNGDMAANPYVLSVNA